MISPTGTSPSIGGADIAAFLPPVTTGPPPVTTNPPPTTAGAGRAGRHRPVEGDDQGARRRAPVKVEVAAAGKVTISATFPPRRSGARASRSWWPRAPGSPKAGTLAVKLKLNATGRKKLKKLKGAKLTLKIVQGGRTTTKTIKLR